MDLRSVVIIDDDDEFRGSLQSLLNLRHWRTLAFGDPESFLSVINTVPPSVLLLDVRMPTMSGLELLANPALERFGVVMMTGHGDIRLAVAALKLGALDFLEKPFKSDELMTAIQSAADALVLRIDRIEVRAAARKKLALLSSRERQVLGQLLAGGSNRSIATNLGLSSRTVELYRSRLMQKLAVNTASELAYVATLGEYDLSE